MAHYCDIDNTHIRVDTTNGNSKHTVEICVRQNNKRNQITHGEDPGEETCLDGTTDKSVDNGIRLAGTGSQTREGDD